MGDPKNYTISVDYDETKGQITKLVQEAYFVNPNNKKPDVTISIYTLDEKTGEYTRSDNMSKSVSPAGNGLKNLPAGYSVIDEKQNAYKYNELNKVADTAAMTMPTGPAQAGPVAEPEKEEQTNSAPKKHLLNVKAAFKAAGANLKNQVVKLKDSAGDLAVDVGTLTHSEAIVKFGTVLQNNKQAVDQVLNNFGQSGKGADANSKPEERISVAYENPVSKGKLQEKINSLVLDAQATDAASRTGTTLGIDPTHVNATINGKSTSSKELQDALNGEYKGGKAPAKDSMVNQPPITKIEQVPLDGVKTDIVLAKFDAHEVTTQANNSGKQRPTFPSTDVAA